MPYSFSRSAGASGRAVRVLEHQSRERRLHLAVSFGCGRTRRTAQPRSDRRDARAKFDAMLSLLTTILGSVPLGVFPEPRHDCQPAATPPCALLARARAPDASRSRRASPGWRALQRDERERAVARPARWCRSAPANCCAASAGPATYWFGVIDGLLKMSNDTALGIPITFTGMPPGGWFGEGTVIKREAYRYNIQALRKSVVAGLERRDLPLAARAQHSVQPLRHAAAERAARPVHRRARDRPHDRPRRARRAQPGGAVPPGALPRRRRAAAHHAAGAGLPGRAVAPARQRGAAGPAGGAG